MTDDQFTRLFKHMTDGFTALEQTMEQRFSAVDRRIDGIYGLLDQNITEHQRQEEERAAMSAQLKRLTHWINELAEATGTKLTYK